MAWSPFGWKDGIQTLQEAGCLQTHSILAADIIVGSTARKVLPYGVLGPSKRYLIWAPETRYDKDFRTARWLIPGWAKLEVMNVWNEEIFFNEAHFFRMNGVNPGVKLEAAGAADLENWKQKGIACLVGYQSNPTPCQIGDVDYDLNAVRMAFALDGAKCRQLDLYGRGFPDSLIKGKFDLALGDKNPVPKDYTGSRGEWHTIKHHLLQPYAFNLCMENTDCGYYITEKIWQAIQARCLPLYYARHNRIDEFFPKDS